MTTTDMLRDARMYILGKCDGDQDLCDAIWSVIHDEMTIVKAARNMDVERSKLSRKVADIRGDAAFLAIV